jgi:hypothetical protein
MATLGRHHDLTAVAPPAKGSCHGSFGERADAGPGVCQRRVDESDPSVDGGPDCATAYSMVTSLNANGAVPSPIAPMLRPLTFMAWVGSVGRGRQRWRW